MSRLTLDQRRAIDPSQSVWVSASAGSGKTHVLSNRVLRLLMNGAAANRILCLTYTKAAAAQMSNRIFEKLADWAVCDEKTLKAALEDVLGQPPLTEDMDRARRLFAAVLDAPGGLKIQTIHSFCETIIGRFPLEAGVSPGASPMDDRKQAEVMDQVKQHLIHRIRQDTAPESVRDAFDYLSSEGGEHKLDDVVAEMTKHRRKLQDAVRTYGSLDAVLAAIASAIDCDPDMTEDTITTMACTGMDTPRLSKAAAALDLGTDPDKSRADLIRAFLDAPVKNRGQLFDAYQSVFLTQKNTIKADKFLITKTPKEADPTARDVLVREAERLQGLQHQVLTLRTFALTKASVIYGVELADGYAAAKKREAVLDYEDLILRVHDLLTRTPSVAPWVLFKLDGGLDHLLVDEAQDTSPLQWQIVAALVDEFYRGLGQRDDLSPQQHTRTLFVVGDVKQSIFSFQGADADMFEEMRVQFRISHDQGGRVMDKVPLSESFRSSPVILDAVDAVFAAGKPGAYGVALPHDPVTHSAFKTDLPGRVEVWPLLGADTKPTPEPWLAPIKQINPTNPHTQLSDAIARTIADWIAHGIYRAGDVLILLQSRGKLLEPLIRALKAHHVPVAGQDRLKLAQQIAVQDLMALAQFLLLPADDLSLACVLKSPIIGWTDTHLFDVAYDRGQRTLWAAVADDRAKQSWQQSAASLLSHLLARADLMTPFELFTQLLSADGVRSRFIARLGVQVEDVLDEFLASALQYELDNPPSLQGFVQWFQADDADIKRDLEQAGDMVRVMTAHGAKGLEAPVVFLPDTTQKAQVKEAFVWQDGLPFWRGNQKTRPSGVQIACDMVRDKLQAERNRLLYVAMTRAEQHLIVCGVKGDANPSWYGAIQAGLEDHPNLQELETPVGPGQMITSPNWSDPKNTGGAVSSTPTDLPPWLDQPCPQEPTPSRPLTPSRPDEDEPAARSPITGGTGTQDPYLRGRLIHQLLELLPDVAHEDQTSAAERFLGTPTYGLNPAQITEMITTTLETLHHPIFSPVFGPGSYAEVPITGVLGTRTLAGTVDRLVVSDTQVMVVDFKTNRPAPKTVQDVPKVYLRQMAIYRAALKAIYPNKSVVCALLWTHGPNMMPLDDTTLDRHFSGT